MGWQWSENVEVITISDENKNSTTANMAAQSCIIRIFAVEYFYALFLSNLWKYDHKSKSRFSGYIFVADSVGLTSTTVMQLVPNVTISVK